MEDKKVERTETPHFINVEKEMQEEVKVEQKQESEEEASKAKAITLESLKSKLRSAS